MARAKHEILTYPDSRIGTIDLGQIALHKHHVVGLLEVDVSEVLDHIRSLKAAGVSLSFFSWMTKTIADAIAENRYVHAVSLRRNKLVAFEEVDVSVLVERTVGGTRVPLPLLIRSTNTKSACSIYDEIRESQRSEITDEGDYVMSDKRLARNAMKLYYALPQRIRLAALKWMTRNPFRMKEMMGTALITSVGAAGHLSGWIIPKSMHNLCFGLGPIAKKPWVVGGQLGIRDILHLTVLFDHDVVDGVPAMKFVNRLIGRIDNLNGARVTQD